MKPLIKVMVMLGVSLAQFSCNSQDSIDAGLIRKSIEVANANYSQAIQKGNLADVVAAYTDDAIMVPPDGDLVKGKQAIEEYYGKLFQMGMKGIEMTTIEVEGSGGTVYEIGKTKVLIHPEGKEAILDSTKYLVIWSHQAGGAWKVQVDIWNLSSR